MSTKIYNGYKIDGAMSAYEMMDLLRNLSDDCTELCKKLYDKEVAKLASLYLDTYAVFGEEKASEEVLDEYHYDSAPLFKVGDLYLFVRDLVEQHSKSNSIFHTDFDFKCEVKLFPLEDKTLFILYTEKSEYLSLINGDYNNELECKANKCNAISPYEYYNNADKPNEITEEDWDLRRNEWNKALGKDENGLRFTLAKIPYTYNIDMVIKYIEDRYEERLDLMSRNKVSREFLIAHKEEFKDMDVSEQIKNYERYKKSEDYKIGLDEAKLELRNIIPSSYSFEDLKRIKIYSKCN